MKTQNLKFGEAVKSLANLAGMRPYTFSKEDEEELYGYDSGITSQVGEDGRSVPSASMIFETTGESEGVVKTIPDLPDETPSEVASEESMMPPLPETGLPEGWTMEQWVAYGHIWWEQNGP